MSTSQPKIPTEYPLLLMGNPFKVEEIITCPACSEQTNLAPPELNDPQGKGWQCQACGKIFTPKTCQTYLGL